VDSHFSLRRFSSLPLLHCAIAHLHCSSGAELQSRAIVNTPFATKRKRNSKCRSAPRRNFLTQGRNYYERTTLIFVARQPEGPGGAISFIARASTLLERLPWAARDSGKLHKYRPKPHGVPRHDDTAVLGRCLKNCLRERAQPTDSCCRAPNIPRSPNIPEFCYSS
jgi:hypothetical protein